MNKWFRLSKTEAWVLVAVLLALLSLLLSEVSTVRDSATRVCTKCLAHRRTVSRKIMWRVVEERDGIYPLAGNEDVICQHQWITKVRSRWSGFGLGGVGDGPGSDLSRPEMRKAVEEYENRTGRNYHDEVQKVLEAAR